MRKYKVLRPYPPDFGSATTTAYRLDIGRDKFVADVRAGLLAPSDSVGTQKRWEWDQVLAGVRARNESVDVSCPLVEQSENEDPFLAGIRLVKTS